MSSGPDEGPAQRRQKLFSLLPDSVFLLDEGLSVVDDNGVMRRWLGLPPAEPGDLLEHVHPDDAALLLAGAVAARHAGPGWVPRARIRFRNADGTWRTVAIESNNQLDDPEIAAIVVRAQDVTAENSPAGLAELDSLLREAVSRAPVALLVLDRYGTVRFADGAALQAEGLVGRPLIDTAGSDAQREAILRALAGETIEEVYEWNGRFWDNRLCPLTAEGHVTGVVAVYIDVTERVLAERALAASEAHLRAVVEAANEAIVVLDPDLRITLLNSRFVKLIGIPVSRGTSLRDLLDERTVAMLATQSARRSTGSHGRYELKLHDAEGNPVWVLVSASPMFSDDGTFLGSVALLTDITANKALERRLQRAALTDAVTGVANRATLSDRLTQSLSRRDAGVVAVLFCDVDELKHTNDTLGHAAGDDLLRHVAQQAARALRPSDTIARFGGDEFVIVCEQLPDRGEALALAERVRTAIASPLTLGGVERIPTVSIGVATSPPFTDPDELLAAADAAVYLAKRDGRNTVRAHP